VRKLTSFVVIGVRSEDNTPINGVPAVGFTFKTSNKPVSSFIKDFLATINETTLQHLPLSHDLAPTEFLPVPSIKISINGAVLL
jgi:hypothetical protein